MPVLQAGADSYILNNFAISPVADSNGNTCLCSSIILPLAAGVQVYLYVYALGATNTITVLGANTYGIRYASRFSGCLLL